jgi:uncharacterized protein (TIGR00266 family)
MNEWYYVQNGKSVGPISKDELVQKLAMLGRDTLVFGPGMTSWTAAKHIDGLRAARSREWSPPPAPEPTRRRVADEIDYEIFGEEMQYVEIELDPEEMTLAEAGAMMYMDPAVRMESRFGDPSAEDKGFFGKVLDAGKRVMTGESLFMTTFSGTGPGKQRVAFAAPYPGRIVPMDMDQLGGELLCQKNSFLCAARGVSVGIAFTKRIGVGLFGGEGFILQRLTGSGLAFVHAGGALLHRKLEAGEVLKVDTGCIVAFHPTVDYDIKFVGGFKNTLFGGEGLFFATLTGPGDIWLQSLPFSRLADRIIASSKIGMGKRKGEGSILGGLGGLLDGDNR